MSSRLDVAGADSVGGGGSQRGGAKAMATKTTNNAVKTRTKKIYKREKSGHEHK